MLSKSLTCPQDVLTYHLAQDMSLFSSTASLRSSILRSIEENGRKYHGYKDGKYLLPDDEVTFPIMQFSIAGAAVH